MDKPKVKNCLLVLFIFCAIFIVFTLYAKPAQETQSVETNEQSKGIVKQVRQKFLVTHSDNVNRNGNMKTERNEIVKSSPEIKLPPGTQMSKLQVATIKKVIPPDGNLLVWGLGNDSPFWHDITRGKVVFIEPAGKWFDKVKGKYPYLEAYKVNYTTKIGESYEKYINNRNIWSDLDIRSQLPPVVTQTPWNVIIVDAPPGYYKGAPGRFQPIYTSVLLAKNGTHIFVDDYERKTERNFSQKMIGSPIEVVKRPDFGNVKRNEQAHFIFISGKL